MALLPSLSPTSLLQVAREHDGVMSALAAGNWPAATITLSAHLREQALYTVRLSEVYTAIKILRAE